MAHVRICGVSECVQVWKYDHEYENIYGEVCICVSLLSVSKCVSVSVYGCANIFQFANVCECENVCLNVEECVCTNLSICHVCDCVNM